MGYDAVLTERVRGLAPEVAMGLQERTVFGARCWMLGGNLAFGVHDDELLVRLGAEGSAAAVADGSATMFDPMDSGKGMANYVVVAGEDVAEDDELLLWLDRGAAFTSTLPEK